MIHLSPSSSHQSTNILVLASNNPGKIAELQVGLEIGTANVMRGWQLKSQSDFGVPDVAEPFLTFIENALVKARHAAKLTGHAAIADDSGLCVHALAGAPGVLSKRYSVGTNDFDLHRSEHLSGAARDLANLQKLLVAMAGVSDRRACYVCVLALVRFPDDPTPLVSMGRWYGEISNHAAGEGGFGYDPIFYLPERKQTVAELPASEKNVLSHRANAIQSLRPLLQETFG